MKSVLVLCVFAFCTLLGCTTRPVQVKLLENRVVTSAISGPVFFLPTVEYVVTIPLDVFAPSNLEEPEQLSTLFIRVASDRQFTLRAESVADTRYPLVLLDGSGGSIDLSVNEMTLNDQSVMTSYNRTGDDKSGEVLVSLTKVFFGLTGPFTFGGGVEDPPQRKLLGSAEVEFRLSPSDIPNSVEGRAPSLTTLFNMQSETNFYDAFWSQNPEYDRTKFNNPIMDSPILVMRELRGGPLLNAMKEASKPLASEELETILRNGVPGIPYRIPATEYIRFSYLDRPGGNRRQLTFTAKTVEGQPLLYAQVFGKRFAKSATAIEIHPDGSLKKYGNTRSSALATGASQLSTATEAWVKEQKSRADAVIASEKLSYSLGAKIRTLYEERQKLTDEISDLLVQIESFIAAGQSTVVLERQQRSKEAQRAVVQIKLDAAINGVDLP